jgi:pullulanase
VDKINYSSPYGATPLEKRKFNRISQSIVFLSQGVPFIYAGEELMRNKKGVHNTYQSPDSINQIDWNFKKTNLDMYNYYKGLIQMRKAHPAFRMSTTTELQRNLKFLNTGQQCVVAYTLDGAAVGDSWSKILVVHNGNRFNISLEIPQDNWTIACNGEEVRPNGIFNWNQAVLNVPASSTMVLYRK